MRPRFSGAVRELNSFFVGTVNWRSSAMTFWLRTGTSIAVWRGSVVLFVPGRVESSGSLGFCEGAADGSFASLSFREGGVVVVTVSNLVFEGAAMISCSGGCFGFGGAPRSSSMLATRCLGICEM